MAVLTVLRFPDPALKRRALPVTAFDAALKKLSGEMLETMYLEGGIGLAAVQVGELRRLVVMDLMNGEEVDGKPAPHQPRFFVNPEILQAEGEITTEEGCLSVVDFRLEVKRAARVECAYQSLAGESRREWLDGMAAVCIQHEIDHLNGKLFIDHLPLLKRDMVKKRLAKIRRAEGAAFRDEVRVSKRGPGSRQARAL